MKIQEKPDYLIFADSAKNGECVKFPDVSRGWGVTIDQTASKPPLEWMNGAFNRIDKNMMYLLQQGVPEWCEYVKYPVNAIIKYNGVLYTAIVENDNAIPTTSDKWKKTIAEVPTASATQKGVVKLSSATNSSSETEAATPKAVKSAYDTALSAQQTANTAKSTAETNASTTTAGRVKLNSAVNSTSETEAATPLAVKNVSDNVSSAHNRISQVHDFSKAVNGRVDDLVDKFQPSGVESRVYSADKRVYMLIRNDGVMGMYSNVKKGFAWQVNHDGWMDGYITADRVGGLDKFVRDRTPPVGVPMPWPQVHPPAGYFECNGSAFDKNKYPKLAVAYPSGKLPDLRGEFIRGWDNARGADPYRVILDWQKCSIQRHSHAQNITVFSEGGTGNPWGSGGDKFECDYWFNTGEAGGNETRPRNVAFMYIVKAE